MVSKFAKLYIKQGGQNENKANLADQELIIASQILEEGQQDVGFFEVVFNALKNDDSHEEYLDPIFFTVMKDPVVISSGYVMDRSTILDDDDKL
jgi:hypothetical protein